MNTMILEAHVRLLSFAFQVALDDDCRHLLLADFGYPPGYNFTVSPVLLEIPRDYPESPPGVGASHVYLPGGLRYKGRIPEDYHESVGPSEQWAWWCYEEICWDPCRDNLITFFELLRAHLTDPI